MLAEERACWPSDSWRIFSVWLQDATFVTVVMAAQQLLHHTVVPHRGMFPLGVAPRVKTMQWPSNQAPQEDAAKLFLRDLRAGPLAFHWLALALTCSTTTLPPLTHADRRMILSYAHEPDTIS
mmetsp:Transcript_58792/g.144101  ORF Transcript_58792/g.144101 Transcript_58792/m.144101 type:complete len:123 (-) Transcript_58792:598-966(-)